MKVLAKTIQSVTLYFQKYATRKEENFPRVDNDIEQEYYNNYILELKSWAHLKPVPRTPIVKLGKDFYLPSLTSAPNMAATFSSRAVVSANRTT